MTKMAVYTAISVLFATSIAMASPASTTTPPAPSKPAVNSTPVENRLSSYLYPAGADCPENSVFIDGNGMKLVALSFDDGPDLVHTPHVLAELQSAGEKATFFLIGEKTHYSSPDQQKIINETMVNIIKDGDEIGSHSNTHPQMSHLTDKGIEKELVDAQSNIQAVLPGLQMHWFRPPYGDSDKRVVDAAEKMGMKTIRWDVDANDWRPGRTPDEVRNDVLEHLHPGAVVLMHSTLATTDAMLPKLLADAHSKGYRFITVDEWWKLVQSAQKPANIMSVRTTKTTGVPHEEKKSKI